jgi:cytoskeletal protein CcmA (bactofilin family)
MFTAKPIAPHGAPAAVDRKRSVLAEDLYIDGNIIAEGVLEFGGTIQGDLTADAIILTPTARVKGRIRARQLTVEGELRGAVTALNISIKNGARVQANFAYNLLDIASGAQVEGQLSHISADNFKL